MGDVFDAMRRASRERGEQEDPPADSPDSQATSDGEPWSSDAPADSEGGGDGERPALPIEQIRAEHPAPPDEPQDRTPDSVSPEEADRDTSDLLPEVEQPAESNLTNPMVNGYDAEVVVHHDRGGAITEQYRAIRTQILARARNRSLQTHVLTSSAPGEGKSVSTINLGVTFSELKNHKTLLIEGDLRRPSFQRLFHKQYTPGMLQLLRGEITDIDEAVHPTVYGNLHFIPAGGHDHLHSTELLTSPRMSQILDRLKDRYDHIFIDSPPVVSVTDAAILGAMCDQVLLVVRLYKTPVEVVDRAKRLLRANNCEVAGVILTHMRVHMPRYLYKYGYYYGSSYGYGPKK